MEQVKAPIHVNGHLTGEYWLIDLEAPTIAATLQPGQFVNVRIEGNLSPYLRRPFSVYRVSADRRRLQVAYKVVGEGTRLMTMMPVGGTCDIIGPLGRGFTLPANARRIAVVGRGIGIAALPALTDDAVAKGVEVHAFLSARNRPNLVGLDVFTEQGCRITTHTDDEPGVGLVTDHLAPLMEELAFDAVYTCGSNRLIRAAHALAQKQGILSQAAMEQHMACGFGDCHGCVIDVNLDRDGKEKGYREVCHHGPVFDTWEVANA